MDQSGDKSKYQIIMAVMQQVQNSTWSPFKLNEIVTLEKCLSEATSEDPRIGLILRKLATGSIFVEPNRKSRHLARTASEKHEDAELARQAAMVQDKSRLLEVEIQYYRDKLCQLKEGESATNASIIELQKSILVLENNCESSLEAFALTLERVFASFEQTLATIQFMIPDFVASIPASNFIQQLVELPKLYKHYLIDLVKTTDNPQRESNSARLLSCQVKKFMISKLNDHLKLLVNLFRNLILIDKVCSIEIPEEIEYLTTLKTHLDFLEMPLQREPPKRILAHHEDLSPCDQPKISSMPPDTVAKLTSRDLVQQIYTKLTRTSPDLVG